LRVLAREVGATLSYAVSEPVRTGSHLVLAAALIAIGLAVTRRLPPSPAGQGRRPLAVEIVVRYPVDAALLMAIFVTPLLHPARPPALDLLMSLGALVPILRIARLLQPEWQRPVRWIAALFVTERLLAFAPQAAIYARVALLLVALAASAGFIAAFRGGGWQRRLQSVGAGWRVVTVAGAAVAAVLFAVSAVANVVGNVSLAKLLTGATLASMFAVAASAALVAVVSGAFRALLEIPAARGLRVVRDHQELLVRRTSTLLRLAGIALWIAWTMRAFHATQSFREVALGILGWRIKVGGLDLAMGDVVAFAVTLWIAVWLSRALRFVLDDAVFPFLDVQRGSAAAISVTASYAVIGIGFGAAVLAAGVEMTRFAVLAGTLGVGIGFGLQNVVNNFVSGLILLYEQPVQVGDVIELADLSGEVRRIGVRSSTVRTFQGADVIVPNSTFISAQVVNWTRSDRWRRVDIQLGVAYGSEPAKVMALLLEIGKSCPAVAATPAPTAFFTGLGDSALKFELRVWTSVDDWVATASTLRASIHEVLPRAGIVLAFPQLDLWVRSVPPGSSVTPLVPGVAQLPSPGTSKAKLPPGQ
jgi:small-conductance mechanosensitive channel